MTNDTELELDITFSQAMKNAGKSTNISLQLGTVVTQMIRADEAKGSDLFHETLKYLDDTPIKGIKYNGSGCLGFAKAAIVAKWKEEYSEKLIGLNVSDYQIWKKLNTRLKTAKMLSRGKTSDYGKKLIAEAKALQLAKQSEGDAEVDAAI